MKPNLLFINLFLLGIIVSCTPSINAQSQLASLSEEQLYHKIVSLDSAMFAAFNSCNAQQLKSYFADDLEFYHDKGGPTLSLDKFIADYEKGLCKPNNAWKSRREVVPGSLKVYPMNHYGALLVGEHRFYETEVATGKEYRRSTAKYTHLFEEKNGVWKVVRSISYDHQMPN